MQVEAYPPIEDYALIGDCHTAALVSRHGSIDWCCLPRFDSGSCFGRLLDWELGGHCTIAPTGEPEDVHRAYVDDTLVLATTFRVAAGEARVIDCFTMRRGGAQDPHRIAIGGDVDLEPGEHDLRSTVTVRGGERLRLSLIYARPETIDPEPLEAPSPEELDRRLDTTLRWWRTFARGCQTEGPDAAGVLRSALVVKALTHAPTGALVAAPTTSLPEVPGGSANWDYRYSWIRDSVLSVRALAELGREAEADGFRRFVARSAAGHAEDLQIVYGVGGERRLVELELEELEGWRGARPVRVGNAAARQLQLDAPGEILNQTWRWCERGHTPDDDHWLFLADLVELAIARWREPDRGLWESRGRPRHFVHSKAMCWSAVDRGLRVAEAGMRRVPVRRWRRARREIARAIEERGFDRRRGVFVQAFGSRRLDAALLMLPVTGLVEWDDPRMVATTDAVREELEEDGLLMRYRQDGRRKDGHEGAFLACSFWLAECLARQGRREEAREVYDRAYATANDVGLFSEERDVNTGAMLGNFPQGLTHLSHIAAAVALQHTPTEEK
ncbi:MAG: glycoside hydrolase family 15 protein [Actinobacteria bacterium]|nr:MAG: glycoside hydrolase family 15 protein [Actinomycetota bacterium]